MKMVIILGLLLALNAFAETPCVIDGASVSLAQIAKEPLKNKIQTLTTFQKMHECMIQHPEDRRIIFFDVYFHITKGLFALPEIKKIEDLEWYLSLITAAAERYRHALYQYETKDFEHMPQVWRVAYDQVLNPSVSDQLDLFLGVNSHISFDIVFSLMDIGTDFSNLGHYADFYSLNSFFAENSAELWNIVEKYEGKHRGEFQRKIKASIMNQWIVKHRMESWRIAVEMDKIKNSPVTLQKFQQQVDRIAAKRSNYFIFYRAAFH